MTFGLNLVKEGSLELKGSSGHFTFRMYNHHCCIVTATIFVLFLSVLGS
jgi:hypothetical protein